MNKSQMLGSPPILQFLAELRTVVCLEDSHLVIAGGQPGHNGKVGLPMELLWMVGLFLLWWRSKIFFLNLFWKKLSRAGWGVTIN